MSTGTSVAYGWLNLGVVIIGSVLIAVLVDPYLTLTSPLLAQAINATVPLLAALIVFAITGRSLLSLVAAALVVGSLVLVDHFKMRALYNNLLFADLKLIPELVKEPALVLGFARLEIGGWLMVSLALLVIVAVVYFAFRRPAVGRNSRFLSSALVVGAMTFLLFHRVSSAIPSVGWMLPMQISGATQVGVVGNVMLGAMASSSVKPKASKEKVDAFWADPLVKAELAKLPGAVPGRRPDIVFVQSESLFEPSLLCGFDDVPVLHNLAGIAGDGFENLEVPVFGHRTLQTEFEVLTGFPVRFTPNSLFAYYELVDKPIAALPRQLGELGYRTVAIHPSRRSFWRRDYAFPAMGFDTFIDGSTYFRPADFSSSWVNDKTLSETILSVLDRRSGPMMVFAVSIENHGPWGNAAPSPDTGLVPRALQGHGRAELADYVARAKEADQALASLIEGLQRRNRPTVLVFYGDHLPALEDVYPQLCFKDGQRPEKHLPPLRVWSNFDLSAPVDGRTYSYLLSARVLHAAGVPLHGAFLAGALVDEIQRDPSVLPADKQRMLDLYQHVAAKEVLGTPVAASPPLAFIARAEAADSLLALQSGSPKLQRQPGPANSALRGAIIPIDHDVSRVDFSLGGHVASAVIRPYVRTLDSKCRFHPGNSVVLFDVIADGDVIAREQIRERKAVIRDLPLSGVDTLSLLVRRQDSTSDCTEVSFMVSQLRCYSPGCDKPGRSDRYSHRTSLSSHPVAKERSEPVPARQTDLVTGADRIAYMMPRTTAYEAPYTALRVTPGNKIFLHPTVEKDAWIDFDVDGIGSVELAPGIEKLNPECEANPSAGMVHVEVLLDGTPVEQRDVDRNYADKIGIKTNGAKSLRVEVDAGNGVAWCDWFAVGFSEIHIKN